MSQPQALAFVLLLLGSAACHSVTRCPSNDTSTNCDKVWVDLQPDGTSAAPIAQVRTNPFSLRLRGRNDDEKQGSYPAWLVPIATSGSATPVSIGQVTFTGKEFPDSGGLYSLAVDRLDPSKVPLGQYALRVGQPESNQVPTADPAHPDPIVTVIRRVLGYASPIEWSATNQVSTDYPSFGQLGFSDKALLVWAGGLNTSNEPSHRLKKFGLVNERLTDSSASLGGYFQNEFRDSDFLAALGAKDVLLANRNQKLRWCAVTVAAEMDCKDAATTMWSLGAALLAVAADQSWAAQVTNGSLSTMPLGSFMSPPPWSKQTPKPDITGSLAFVAFGNVNGDSQVEDLVAWWQDKTSGSANVRVFLRNGNGFAANSPWSAAFQQAATAPADALAVADMDGDGLGDLIVGRDHTVTVYQSLGGIGMWPGWVFTWTDGPPISAITTGCLSATCPNGPYLVVARSDKAVANQTSSVYLDAFQALPP